MRLKGVSLLLGATCCIFSQTATAPAFEAASIKLNTSGSNSSSTNGNRTQVIFANVSFKRLMQAYGVQDFQLAAPDWMADVKFDIAAKYPPGETAREQRGAMLQTLLAEQLHLVIHRETKEMPAYALVVAKNGPNLEASKEIGDSTVTIRGKFDYRAVTMAGFAKQLAQQLEHPVVDKTGLTGVYTLKLEWIPDEPGGAAEPALGPTLVNALQDQLGLKLQTQKLPVEIIVVDSADRTPVEK